MTVSVSTRSRKLRACFVGCGNIAQYHVKAAAAAGGVQVTCLVDPSPSARDTIRKLLVDAGLSDPAGPAEFDSLEEAVAADSGAELFEACVVLVPSFFTADGADLHEVVAGVALRAHRHLLLEKPVCVSVEAAERLVDLHQACASDRVFAVAENARFWPEVLRAKAAIEAGDIGEVLSARAKFWESAGGEWACDYEPGTWRCDPSKLPAASFTYDGASHWIRPLRLWLGDVDSVVGVCGRTLEHMPGVSMSQHILQFKSGKSAIFESMLAPKAISDQPFFTVQGSLGELVLDGFEGGCRLYREAPAGSGAGSECTELCKEGWDASYVGEWVDFVAAVLDGAPCAGLATEAVEDLRVVQAILRAGESRSWERVGATAPSP